MEHTTKSLYPTWRWYGPQDPISLSEIEAAGAQGIVTALHQIPNGAVWDQKAILERKNTLLAAGLPWSVVESLPVHEGIKTNAAECTTLLNNYRTSLQHLAACGITTVCYNFMPVLDWTRTWLRKPVSGGTTLELRAVSLVAFDVFHLERRAAKSAYSTELVKAAEAYYNELDATELELLERTILLGLPGSEEAYSLAEFKKAIQTYDQISVATYRDNLHRFLSAVVPTAAALGINLSIHPDDPPYSVLGLPRIVCNAADLSELLNYVPETANGLCLCTGSLGVNGDNNLAEIAEQFATRIHFVHLRNVIRTADGGFYESGHLEGDVDMRAVMDRLGKGINKATPYRPDHGFTILADRERDTYPGYSLYGRMRGLAELEGLRVGLGY